MCPLLGAYITQSESGGIPSSGMSLSSKNSSQASKDQLPLGKLSVLDPRRWKRPAVTRSGALVIELRPWHVSGGAEDAPADSDQPEE